MTTKLGVAVLSFAHGHAAIYCDRLATYDDVRLAACWDDDAPRGAAMAARYGMRYSPHPEDAFDDPNVQAVIVTCETHRHAEMAVAAAAAGKHILCQKPMALTLADCDRMIAAVESAGVKFMMAFQMRHDPSNQKIKQLIEEGAVGRISLVRRRHCIPVLLNDAFIHGPTRWHLDPEKNLGMFMDDAVHAADFLHWILGYPMSVMAEIGNTVTDVAPDDTGVAIYRYASGAMAVLVNSSVALAGENTCEVYGNQGVIIQNHDDLVSTNVALPPHPIALKLYRRGETSWQDLNIPIPASHAERIAAVPRAFVDCILQDREPPATAQDGRVAVEMVLAAYRSAQEGRRVRFPLQA
jgi:predicted dehydrogenase